MHIRPAAAVLGGALLLALLVLVATSAPVTVMTERPRTPAASSSAVGTEEPLPSAAPSSTAPPPEQDDGFTGVLTTIIKTLLVVLAVVVLVFLANLFARSRIRLRHEVEAPPIEPLPDVAETVRRNADQHLDALLSGRPRNAIVACWLRLEASVAEAGLPRLRSETSAEYTARILSTFTVDPTAINDLAALYREARFSTHDLGEADRQRAIADLQDLHASLVSVAR